MQGDNLYNINIERAVLSSIIFDPMIYEEIAAKLKPQDFYLPFHQHLFMAMERLTSQEKPIDEEFLVKELKKEDKFDETAMVEVLSANPISDTTAYVEEIKALSSKRSLVTLATEIKKLTIEEDLDVTEVMDRVEKKLYQITQESISDDFRDSRDITKSMLAEIERLKAMGNSKLIGVDTGFRNLNEKTSGFGKGDLIIIAARPAMGKCLGKGTKVVMYDGTLKRVEDVKVGDLLMGDDSTPRRVLSLARGREEIYWVRQDKGIDYRVNKSHILSLKCSKRDDGYNYGEILNISVDEYLKKSDKFKSSYKGYKVAVDFEQKSVEIEPYSLGLWLGSSDIKVTTKDSSNIDIDSIKDKLRELNLIDNRHIPHKYIANSKANRLKLLAGIIDSSGYYDDKNYLFEIPLISKRLAQDIRYLANTLGFRVTFNIKEATTDSGANVYIVRIYGNLDEVPTKVSSKRAKALQSSIDYRYTDIKVEFDKVDEYYGFVLDGNHLFLLEDMTVTHNTALVLNMALKAIERGEGVAFFSLEMPAEQLMLRMLSAKTSIPLQSLRVGDLRDDEWKRLSEAVDDISRRKLFVDDGGYATIHHVRSKLRKLKAQNPEISMAIIDYLQLMSGEGSREGRQQEISEISRGLKQLARELDMPIIALSQLNRSLESRENKRPMLSDLRESGAIEQDADIILFVYRDDVYREAKEKEKEMKAKAEGKEYKSNYRKKPEEDTELIIGKQRNGPTGTVDLIFQKRFTRFVDKDKNDTPYELIYEDGNIDTREGKVELPPI